MRYRLAVVAVVAVAGLAVAVVLERDRLAGALAAEGVTVGVLVARHRVDRLLGLLGRLDPDVAVAVDAGARRDELADDDVLLQTQQRVAAGVDRGIGENTGRLLERRSRQPRLGRQRGLGDAHQHRTAGGPLPALGHDPAVLLLELRPLGQLARKQVGLARLEDVHPLEHLTDDDLDVLVVDRHALRAVDVLHLLDEVQLNGARPEDAQHLVRVDGAGVQLLTDVDVLTLLDAPLTTRPLGLGVVPAPGEHALRDGVLDRLRAVVRSDDELGRLVGLLDLDLARDLTDRRAALRLTSLEQLDDTRQTVGNVLTRDTTGVEGPHRELRAGLTDRLGGDDADRLAGVDELAGRERTAVAERTDADLAVAGEHAAHPHLVHAGVDQLGDEHVAEDGAGLGQRLLALDDGLGHRPRVDDVLDVVAVEHHLRVRSLDGDRDDDASLGAAVLLAHDDVLRDVHETTGEVAGVGGAQCGVGQTLTRTVRGDEVLQHRQPLAEVGLDRPRDDLALRVGDKTTHTGDLLDLQHVSSRSRADHHLDRVEAGEVLLHLPRDLGRRPGPDLDELLPALVVGDDTALVLLLDLLRLLLVTSEDLLLVRRSDDVGDGDGDTGAGGPVETGLLESVERRRDLDLRIALLKVVDDLAELRLLLLVVDEGVVERKLIVEQAAA